MLEEDREVLLTFYPDTNFITFYTFSYSLLFLLFVHMYGVCMVLSLYINISLYLSIYVHRCYIFIFSKSFESRLHISCPLIFLCIFPKNKKIFLHNHSSQFRKFIINKTYNLCFSFISCPNKVLYGNFSPLIQDPVQSHLLYLVTVSFNVII